MRRPIVFLTGAVVSTVCWPAWAVEEMLGML